MVQSPWYFPFSCNFSKSGPSFCRCVKLAAIHRRIKTIEMFSQMSWYLEQRSHAQKGSENPNVKLCWVSKAFCLQEKDASESGTCTSHKDLDLKAVPKGTVQGGRQRYRESDGKTRSESGTALGGMTVWKAEKLKELWSSL